jgi:myo-inositol 2-dehydrogenase / D-chiro-inositol 1-dehydrogenase
MESTSGDSRLQASSASRRDFLAQSTALAAGGVALGSFQHSVYAAADDTLKIGLVGCGGRGTGAARDALSTDHNVKLVALADVFPDRAQSSLEGIKGGLGEKSNKVDVSPDKIFVGFDAFQKIMADPEIDMVILATPPGFRPMQFEAAVKAGKHVFMEKPVAVDAPGVRRVLEASKLAKEKKLKVGVGLQRHHDAGYIETIKRIHDGAIGEVIALRAYWNGGGVWDPPLSWTDKKSEMEYQIRNWYYYNWLSGDHIVEQHIHNLDVCNWIKNAYPVKANGMGGRQVRTDKKYGEIFDHHYVEYQYADGSVMYSQCRHIAGCWNSVSEFVHGTKGTSNPAGSISAAGNDFRYRGPNKNAYQVEHENLQKAIVAGADYSEADNGAYSSMTAILGRLATYSGKEINWDDAIASNIDLMPKSYSWDAEAPIKASADGTYPIAVPGQTNVL